MLAITLGLLNPTVIFACRNDERHKLPSPSGEFTASDVIEICQGFMATMTHINQTIYLNGLDGTRTKIFEGNRPKALLRWVDETHLEIIVTSVSQISLSIHRSGPVTIVYNATYYLKSGTFLRRLDEEQNQIETLARQGKLKQSDVPSLLRSVDDSRRWYREFSAWMSENIGTGS